MLELKEETTQQRKKTKKEFMELLFWVGVCTFFIALFVTAVLFQSAAYSAVSPPSIISYQGKLIESGESVTTTQSIKFLIYNDPTTTSTLLYSASGTTAIPLGVSVTPSSGIFSINLGATSTNSLSPDIFKNNDPLYLEVVVETTTLTPRKRITSVPFAINSEYLSGISATSTASSSTYIPISASDGSFTFNTTTINTDFTVDSGIFYVDSINNRVGINTSTPNANYLFTVSGTSYLAGSTTISDLLTVSGKVGAPRHVGNIVSTSAQIDGANDVKVQGDYAYVIGSTDDSLSIIDISDKVNPVEVGSIVRSGSIPPLDQAEALDVSGGVAYIVSQGTTKAITLIDVKTPSSPKYIGAVKNGDGGVQLTSPNGIFVSGNYIYVVDSFEDSIQILDVTNISQPELVFASSSAFLDGAERVFVSGGYAYVTASGNSNSLIIFDVSNPGNTFFTGRLSFELGESAVGIFVSGNYAYITDVAGDSLKIVDISDPYNPTKVGELDDGDGNAPFLDSSNGIFVSGNYAYIASFVSDALEIVDISSSTNPVHAGNIIHGSNGAILDGAENVVVSGNYAYVVGRGQANDALEIIDISGATISNAEIGSARISNLSVDAFANFDQNINIRGGLNVGGNSLLGGDLSLSAASSTLTSTNTLAFSHRAVFSASSTHGNVFTFASRNTIDDSARLFTIQNPSSTDRLVLTGNGYLGLGGTSTPSYTLSVSGTAYITATTTLASTTINGNLNVDSGVFYVDSINNRVGINSSTPNANYLFTVSGTSYLAGTTTVSDLLNVEGKIRNPTLVGQTNSSGKESLFVQGDYTYVAGDIDGLRIFDTSNKKSISQISVVNTSGSAVDVVVANNYAFVADTAGGVDIIDVSNPASPVLVDNLLGSVPDLSSAVELETQGKYLYVGGLDNAAANSLLIYDISAPGSISLLGKVGLAGSANDISVAGNYLYIASGATLSIVDITDPTTPIIGSTEVAFADTISGAEVQGNYAYLGVDTYGLSIIDIGNLASVSEVGLYDTAGEAAKIDVAGGYAYLSDGSDGFDIIDISNPLSPTLIKNFTDITTAKDIKVVGNYLYILEDAAIDSYLSIYDISGAKISNTEIGSAKISNLNVSNYSFFDQGINIRGGISVGGSALINGDISFSNSSSTLNATNTLRFSNMALFQASSTNGYNFVFDTTNLLSADKYILSVRNNGVAAFSISAFGDVHASGTLSAKSATVGTPGAPGDLAERVDISFGEIAEPGDVMCVDQDNIDTYKKCVGPGDQSVAGVISTLPTITVGNGKTDHTAVMAIVGRVPIKVTLENGDIKRGDLLIAASSTGKAMKYDLSKDNSSSVVSILGVALDNFTSTTSKSNDRILGLVRTGWVYNQKQSIYEVEQNISLLAKEIGINLNDNPEELNIEENNKGKIEFVNGELNLNNNYIINVAGIRGVDNKWEVDLYGRFVTKLETEEGEEILYAIQSKNTEFVFSGSGIMIGGQGAVEFDENIQLLMDKSKPIKVSITLTQEANGIFITSKDHAGFSVRETQNGHHDAMFDWVVIASRIISDGQPVSEENQQQENDQEELEQQPEEPIEEENNEPQEEIDEVLPVEEEIIDPIEEIPVVEDNIEPPAEEPQPQEEEPPIEEEQPLEENNEPQEEIDEVLPQEEEPIEEEIIDPIEEIPVVEDNIEPPAEEPQP